MQQKNQKTALQKETLSSILADHYPALGELEDFSIIGGGMANTNVRIQTKAEGKRYLLKICDEKNAQELLAMISALLFMQKSATFFTAWAIRKSGPDNTNDASDPHNYLCCGRYEGQDLRIIVMDFLSGSPRNFDQVNHEMLHDLAKHLAKLHALPPYSNTKYPLPPFAMGIAQMAEIFEDSQHNQHPFVQYLHQKISTLKDRIALEASSPLKNDKDLVIVHGDLFPDNVLWNENKVVGIIDFEEVCQESYLLDVAMTLIGCCYPTNNQLNHSLVTTFIKSYTEQRPADFTLLKEWMQYSALSIAFWRFRQFNIRTPDENLKNKYQEMEERAKELDKISISF